MQATTGTTNILLVSIFPSGRMVVTAPSGRTVASDLGYENLLGLVQKDIPEAVVKNFVWNEKMLQTSEQAIATVLPGAAIGPKTETAAAAKKYGGLFSRLKQLVRRD